MGFIDAVESHYRAVKARIIALNSSRVVVGFTDAMDWPPKELQFEAFYMLTLGDNPVGRSMFSPSAMGMIDTVQWLWAVKGSDLPTGSRGRNRGDRYRTHWKMKTELMNGLYPYFTEKKVWSAVQTSTSQISLQSASEVDPASGLVLPEMIWWSPPNMTSRQDKVGGLIWGSAQVHITQMSDAIVA